MDDAWARHCRQRAAAKEAADQAAKEAADQAAKEAATKEVLDPKQQADQFL